MRGTDEQTGALFSYLSPDALVPADHPLRAIRPLVNAALDRLSGRFAQLYSPGGRASIAPEKLLRALLLQAFYGVRSERQLMEQVSYNMLFRWFIGLSMDAPVWDVTVFTKNRQRLLDGDIAVALLLSIMGDPAVKRLLSNEHFSVDGTLIDAWASMKSFRRRDGGDDEPSGPGRNAERDFRGDKRSNETHASVTDPDARLYRKSNIMTMREHPMIGKWRITEMELWDREFIDLLGPGYIQFNPEGGGEFVFGAVHGGLDCHYGPASIHFTWMGHDEMDEASGDGDAQLEEDGTLTGDIRFHLGDESSFIAKPW